MCFETRRSWPPMMPATPVPWPTQSVRPVLVMSMLLMTLCNCGWAVSTPLSSTATLTPAPRVCDHASLKLSICCAHGSVLIAEAGEPNWLYCCGQDAADAATGIHRYDV